ncbi:MAG: hypothetical protein E6J38_01630 [Chloroflexi bacterium]|nr:MAG: hypothetical protein E6J38_01630 [Chloroflexota bacterium]
MLVREQPATDLTIATRILARSGALVGDRRITLRLRDVMYIGGRDVELSTMTPYDVAVVLSSDGRMSDGDYVCAPTLRGCVVAALRRVRGENETSADDATIEAVWLDLVSQARISGALIGAFPTENEAP